jgi:hypothetical protein
MILYAPIFSSHLNVVNTGAGKGQLGSVGVEVNGLQRLVLLGEQGLNKASKQSQKTSNRIYYTNCITHNKSCDRACTYVHFVGFGADGIQASESRGVGDL